MAAHSGPNIVNDGLIFHFDINNSLKSWKGKPVENLAPSGGRTGSSSLPRQSHHIETYNYFSNVEAYGRKDTIKVTISPTGNNATAPYADFGFAAYRSGGSQIGDVYWVSFDYINIKGGNNPNIGIVYANGYKNPTSANIGTFSDQTSTPLSDGWTRWSAKVTITEAGNTWWRFGQNSNQEEVEFYLDNFQIIYSDVDAPFVDGTRSNTQALVDISGQDNTITVPNLTYNSDGTFDFNGSSNYATDTSFNIGTDPVCSVSLWIKRTGSFSSGGYWGFGGGSNNNGINGYCNPARANKIGWDLWGQTTFDTGVDYPLDEWVNVVWVKTSTGFTTSNLKIYINGVDTPLSHTARNNSSTVSLVSGITFGRISYNIGGYYAPGVIASANVYNRVLTAAEVKQNFEATRATYGI